MFAPLSTLQWPLQALQFAQGRYEMERQENDMIAVISTAEASYQTSLKGMLRKLGDMAMPLKVGFLIGLAFAVIGLVMEFLFGASL